MEGAASSPSTSVDLIRILLRHADRLGLDRTAVCADAGLEPVILEDPDARLPVGRFNAVWEAVAARSGDRDFGLRLGQAVRDYTGGHILYAVMMNCPTVGEALERFCRYHGIMADVVRLRLRRERDPAAIRFATARPRLVLHRQHAEFVASLVGSILGMLTGDRAGVVEVLFQHPRPEDTAVHRAVFGAPVHFAQAENEVRLPAGCLGWPVLLARAELLLALEPLARQLADRLTADRLWGDRVLQLQSRALVRGDPPSLETVARELALSPRHLQNRLKEEGTSYRALLEQVRREFALRSLEDGESSLADITFLLGFAEQSAFQRAFKKWTGMTPGAYRRQKG